MPGSEEEYTQSIYHTGYPARCYIPVLPSLGSVVGGAGGDHEGSSLLAGPTCTPPGVSYGTFAGLTKGGYGTSKNYKKGEMASFIFYFPESTSVMPESSYTESSLTLRYFLVEKNIPRV